MAYLYINSGVQFVTGPSPIPALVPNNGDIDIFSELGSGWPQGTPCREWLVLSKRRNAVDEHFPARPKGANQMTQSGVTALNKDMPLSAVCSLSWVIWLALNMSISPLMGTTCPCTTGLELPSTHSYGYESQSSPTPSRTCPAPASVILVQYAG